MKAKRMISCVSALALSSTAMVSGFSVSAAGENVVLKGEHIESSAGASFELKIDLAELAGDASKGFSGCEFALEYDASKLQDIKISEGNVLSSTGATAAELAKAPGIGEEVTMVSTDNSNYNCFDYNIVKSGDSTLAAILWCTGLDSSSNWASKTGTIVTISGKVYADAKDGEEIPVKIVPISRDGNEDIIFGYVDGAQDKLYTTAIDQDGLIIIKNSQDPGDLTPLWGDVNDNGSVSASDLVAMIKFLLDPEEAGLTKQGILNGNLYQGDKNTDLSSDDVLTAQDLFLLKKYLLKDIAVSAFPVMDINTVG